MGEVKESKEICEATEVKVPEILLRETKIPTVCRFQSVNDDMQGGVEGLLGSPEEPESGAFRSCNNDKAKIREILSKEREDAKD